MPPTMVGQALNRTTGPTTGAPRRSGDARSTPKAPALVMGLGFGGFIDGILLHQILQAGPWLCRLRGAALVLFAARADKPDLLLSRAGGMRVDGPTLVGVAGVTVGLAEQRPAREIQREANAGSHDDEDEKQEKCDSAFHVPGATQHIERAKRA
jgi:hypothetical protein